MRNTVDPYLAGGSKTDVENLWVKCATLIGEYKTIATAYNLIKTDIEQVFLELNQGLVSTIEMDTLLEILENGLENTDLKSCVVSLHAKNVDPFSSESIIFNYQFGSRIEMRNQPENREDTHYIQTLLNSTERRTFFVNQLHLNNQLIGYVLLEPGTFDACIYSALAVQLSSAIHSALALTNLLETNSRLETAQNEIIANLNIIQVKTRALEESNIKLSELDNLKNDFIANITHDFRSPLMVIMNAADLGLSYDGLDDSTVKRRYNMITSAAFKLKGTIDRLLELAKMDAKGVKLTITKVNLKEYCMNITNFFQSAAMSSGIIVKSVLPNNEINDFHTDCDKLEEILHNIFSNAFKYVDPAHGEITLSLIEKEKTVVLMIEDNGIGISPDKLELIFNRFEQAHSDRDIRQKGTGIGLAFAKQLVEFLHGKIWAESEGAGKGSRFLIELRKGKDQFLDSVSPDDKYKSYVANNGIRKNLHKAIAESIEDNLQTDEPQVYITSINKDNEYDCKKGLIVIVDDNRYIREILKEYLENNGYNNLILANNGMSGIEAIYKYNPDLIVSDFNMPKMHGDELHDILLGKPEFNKIPIIFLTAVVNREFMLERKMKGAFAYLGKPVDEHEFIISVDSGMKAYMEYKQLIQQSSIDGLTRLSNRLTIQKFLNDRIMLRSYRPLSVIFFDLDHFKSLNDHFGHLAGDAVLADIGKIVADMLREYDRAGRYGGEEFIVVLPDTSIQKALIVAEKIRIAIEEHFFVFKELKLKITASFGISSLIDNADAIQKIMKISNLLEIFEVTDFTNTDWEKTNVTKAEIGKLLIYLADKAMYEAKNTHCINCNYQSGMSEDFTNHECPVCKSMDLKIGRNSVALYKHVNNDDSRIFLK